MREWIIVQYRLEVMHQKFYKDWIYLEQQEFMIESIDMKMLEMKLE